jgi:hypothetical protein
MHYLRASAGYKILDQERIHTMSIEKKSLISTLKTTKKANVASAPATKDGSTSRKTKIAKSVSTRMANVRGKM